MIWFWVFFSCMVAIQWSQKKTIKLHEFCRHQCVSTILSDFHYYYYMCPVYHKGDNIQLHSSGILNIGFRTLTGGRAKNSKNCISSFLRRTV